MGRFHGFGLAAVAAAALAATPARSAAPPPLVVRVALDNEPITPGAARYVLRGLREAEAGGAVCMLLVLDTPGGLLESTRQLVKAFLASSTPVVVYVAPSGSRAASAGVFITLAAHVAAMAPGCTIGAAHPVSIGGLPLPDMEQPAPQEPGEEPDKESGRPGASRSVMEQKVVNDTVAWARALAKLRRRNEQWAARAVAESISATTAEAVEQGVVDLEAADIAALLRQLDGRTVVLPDGRSVALRTQGAVVRDVSMWWGEVVLTLVSRPDVALLLLMLGFYGLLFEFYTPGWGVGGTLGAVCLLLGMFGLSVLPVNYLGLALIAVAMALFVAEAFVPSFGALTLGGIVCLVLGSLMLVDSPAGFSRVSLHVAAPLALATAAIVTFLMAGVVRTHRRPVQTGDDALAAEPCQALEAFRPQDGRYTGAVLVHGERWSAVSDAPLAAGQPCRIVARRNLTLIVAPAESEAAE